MTTLPRILDRDVLVKRNEPMDKAFFDKRFGLIRRYLDLYATQIETAAAASDSLITVGLARLDDVLAPFLERVQAAGELGFLVATSSSNLQLEVGETVTFALDDTASNALFQPTTLMSVQRSSDPDMWAVVRLDVWDKEAGAAGAFSAEVISVNGDVELAAHDDWVICAGSGLVNVIAEQIADDAAQVAVDRAYVAGIAADIQDGPVLSVNGANGTVTLGIDDIPDLTTTLAGKSSTSHNHDAAYAALGHNHDAAYSALGHNHDADYADIAHNHDATYEALANKGAMNGYAGLDSDGKVPAAQLPALFNDSFWFGSGSDGDVTISSGTTTLTRDMYYNNLTISGTGKLDANGFRVFVLGVLNLDNAPADAITITPVPGGAGSTTTGGAAATGGGSANGTISAQNMSTAGASGVSNDNGVQSSAPTAVTGYGGNAGASSGAGGDSASKSGGAGRARASNVLHSLERAVVDFALGALIPTGGAPGAGGGSGGGTTTPAAGRGGGGGGAGNGNIGVFAKVISRGASTAAGAISSKGGNGGAGVNAASSTGGGGGGSGGGGGHIHVVAGSLTGSQKSGAIVATGGTGGNGGTGSGAFAGDGGDGGNGGRVVVIDLGANAITVTSGSSGSAGSGTTGGSGGACSAAL